MAITWDFKITVLDYNRKHVSAVATRTDTADPGNPKIYTVPNVHIDTAAQKTALLDTVWAMWQADVALEAKKIAFAPTITSLEAAAKANLEAREG